MEENKKNKLEAFFCDNDSPKFAKVGIYGTAGTGKTRTSFEIAKGLYKEKGFTKPVVFFDTERGSDWIIPLFKKEGIEILVKKSRTFTDLMEACKIAQEHASIMIVDSVSHVWRELTESYLRQHNLNRYNAALKKYNGNKSKVDQFFKPSLKLEFHHWGQIKPVWAKFTDFFLNSSLHMVVCGRAGDIYEYIEKEEGGKELIKSGSRMATEKELSYEPSLLIETRRRLIDNKEELYAFVEKDRSDSINGNEFILPTYEDFKPHFDFIDIGGEYKNIDMYSNSSASGFEGKTLNPEDEFAAEKRKREILSEEIKELMSLKIPGQTSDEKQQKRKLLNEVFKTMSWTAIENMPSDVLKNGLEQLRALLIEL